MLNWSALINYGLMDDVHLSTACHFRYELRLSAENFQQQFGAREVCRASQIMVYDLQYRGDMFWKVKMRKTRCQCFHIDSMQVAKVILDH